MTEMLLQKLEERMMLLLSEIEDLRKEVVGLRQDNTRLRTEKETNTRKVSDLLSLLDSVTGSEYAAHHVTASDSTSHAAPKPISFTSVSLVGNE